MLSHADTVYFSAAAKDGDPRTASHKGWNSTAEHEANKRKQAEINKRLVQNAIKRGDSVGSAP